MCLNAISSKRTAKKDWYTIKLVEQPHPAFAYSFYRYARQPYNKLLKSHLDKPNFWGAIHKGLHSFVLGPQIPVLIRQKTRFYDSGIVLCRIPKGAEYYLGKGKEVASNKLEIVEVVFCVNNKVKLDEEVEVNLNGSQVYRKLLKVIKSYGYNIKPS